MEKLLDSGRVRSIGISNFDQQQTERILAVARIVPVTNQVECHPFKNKRSLIKFSSANNITVTAHTPLGRAKNETDTNSPISDPNVLALAKKHNKTAAQTILRYSVFGFEKTFAILNIWSIFSIHFRFKTVRLSFRNQRKNIDWWKIWTYLISSWAVVTCEFCTHWTRKNSLLMSVLTACVSSACFVDILNKAQQS